MDFGGRITRKNALRRSLPVTVRRPGAYYQSVHHEGRLMTLGTHLAMLAACAALASGTAHAASCSAVSGPDRVPLIELYTSEGCDSCPPADRWLATGAAEAFRAGRAVPLALHVDYWDHLGWRDPYASAQFSARQRASAQRANSRVIYTPQVQVNGRDFRGWGDRGAVARALEAGGGPARVKLALDATRDAAAQWTIAVTAEAIAGAPRGAGVYLALYESGLVSSVKAGENRGATLRHDFVVREWLGPLPLDAHGRLGDKRKLPVRVDVDYSRAGIVAFVQDSGGEILQALALPLCGG